ncbi:type I glutamate--ammonia ligase [PVC group bacterium (ex Bugula neritina AB1)]|nr:type I glutamate--ammonia ligase [PVC group bacterium (ex Bugula neritina AB1)]
MKVPKDVLKYIKDENVEFVDFRFMDFLGTWQHFSVPAGAVEEDTFEEGLGFDGSSIRGWKAINESDMIVVPDPETALLDPFTEHKTLFITCNIKDPITKENYTRDPRYIALKAEEYLKSTQIADTAFFGPEAEFFIFDSIRYANEPSSSFFEIDSVEAAWNTGAEGVDELGNLGHKIRHKEGYFPCPPTDKFQDLRSEMVLEMIKLGIDVECQHHEVATAGQAEIDIKYGTLVATADRLLQYKYIVKNVADRNGYSATFMPKPIYGDNGSGMHTHVSLWKGGKPLFGGDGYAGLSEMALHFIGGILKHAKSLVAFTNPTISSYKRLVPGYEAPVNLAYSSRNRSAAIRIPMYSDNPKAKRVEFRCPDPSCNPYLAFSAILMAGLDGVQNKIDPGAPLDKNIYDLPSEELDKINSTPESLRAALQALKNDHEYLLKGDVFTSDVIESWIDYKLNNEVKACELRPHPYEFELYYDV